MHKITLREGQLTCEEQHIIQVGFETHSIQLDAPIYKNNRLNWLVHSSDNQLVGALSADVFWDWVYIDELWVDETHRSQGFGRQLIEKVEAYACDEALRGLWLWTQSWQAANFYEHLDYEVFARFPDFPEGHSRIGYRKYLDSQAKHH